MKMRTFVPSPLYGEKVRMRGGDTKRHYKDDVTQALRCMLWQMIEGEKT